MRARSRGGIWTYLDVLASLSLLWRWFLGRCRDEVCLLLRHEQEKREQLRRIVAAAMQTPERVTWDPLASLEREDGFWFCGGGGSFFLVLLT